MPGVPALTAFAGQVPPWNLVSLDANLTNIQALLKDVGNYSTYVLDAGGADAYSVTYGAGITFALTNNPVVVFKAVNANTGASTMNANATGVKSIKNVDGSALVANQIKAGGVYAIVYDGTNWMLLNPTPGIVGSAAVFSSTLSVGAVTATSINFGQTTLNYYGEGTWTPSLGGTTTYTSRNASYTRVGRLVGLHGRIQVLLIGTGSTGVITSGIPFAESTLCAGFVGYFNAVATNVVLLSCYISSNTIRFTSLTAAAPTVTDGTGVFGNSTDVAFNVPYEA